MRVPMRVVSLVLAVLVVILATAATAMASELTMRVRVLDMTEQTLVITDTTLDKGRWRSTDGPETATPYHIADQTMESEYRKAKGDTRWQIGESAYKVDV